MTVFLGLLGGFLALLFLGIPVVVGLVAVSLLGISLLGDVPVVVTLQRVVSPMDDFVLMAIPLFILAGEVMNAGGVSRRLYGFASALVGHLTGGLAQVNVLTSVLNGGLSGSAAADAALDTKVLLPIMVRNGYSPAFAAAVTAASATIAPVIPPSIAMILYAAIAQVSIGQLFVAGIIPGLLMGLFLSITVHVISRRRGYRSAHARASLGTIGRSLVGTGWALLLPMVIIGGIRFGFFTATEAAAVAVLYSLFVGMVVYRELRPADLPRVLVQAAADTGVVMLIVGVAAPFAWLLTVQRVPQWIAEQIVQLSSNPLVFLILVNVMMFVLGSFLEATALLLLVTPVVAPVAAALGIDPIHFGVIIVINLMIGNVTPPFGQLVYLVSALGRIPAEQIFMEVMLFLPALLAVVGIVTLAPASFLWLVKLIGP